MANERYNKYKKSYEKYREKYKEKKRELDSLYRKIIKKNSRK
jgi:hypothetical protein